MNLYEIPRGCSAVSLKLALISLLFLLSRIPALSIDSILHRVSLDSFVSWGILRMEVFLTCFVVDLILELFNKQVAYFLIRWTVKI